MNDLTLGQIEVDENFNFRKKYDEENDIFDNNLTVYMATGMILWIRLTLHNHLNFLS